MKTKKQKRTDELGMYLTRRDQLEDEMMVDALAKPTRANIAKQIKSAAFVGACGERDRTLAILKRHGLADVANEIMAQGVLEVLGWES